jgi:ribosomal protein L37AE/L43A/TM2 domain-containing membrane protein YozV
VSLEYFCPHCQRRVRIEERQVGHVLTCGKCHGQFHAAAPDPVTADPPPVVTPTKPPPATFAGTDQKYCQECGALIRRRAAICPQCGVAQPGYTDIAEKAATEWGENHEGPNRIGAGLLALLLGPLGVHKFIMGYTAEAVVTLAVSVVGACIYLGPLAMWVIGLAEGITYLSMSDRRFHETYVAGRRGWF